MSYPGQKPDAVLRRAQDGKRKVKINYPLSFIHAYELMVGLHVFRQTGLPRRVDCLAPPSVCHIKTKTSC